MNFEHTEGSGIAAEVLDFRGNVVASGERFRFEAAQGDELLLHVFVLPGGAGAFTPVINVLPQIVSVESQALRPGDDVNPGGPTTSIVVTLQGDRLDPQTAEDIANYSVIYLGADGLRGTDDDRRIPGVRLLNYIICRVSNVWKSPDTSTEVRPLLRDCCVEG